MDFFNTIHYTKVNIRFYYRQDALILSLGLTKFAFAVAEAGHLSDAFSCFAFLVLLLATFMQYEVLKVLQLTQIRGRRRHLIIAGSLMGKVTPTPICVFMFLLYTNICMCVCLSFLYIFLNTLYYSTDHAETLR